MTLGSSTRRVRDWLAGRDVAPVDPVPVSTVLVVDDDEVIRALIAVTLSAEGFAIVEASNCPEALAMIATRHPDVVTLDANMPGISGWEIAKRLRDDPAGGALKVVMVAAGGGDRDPVQRKELGIDGFLAKPFDPKEIIALIRRLTA